MVNKAVIVILLLLCSVVSHAICHDVVVGQRSYHRDETYEEDGKRYDYENTNPLLGCITEEGYIIAAFENSYSDPALLLAHSWQTHSLSPYISPYLALGVALGYKDHMEHVGAFSPYGFVGVDIHPADQSFGLMISTVGQTTTIGLRFALK